MCAYVFAFVRARGRNSTSSWDGPTLQIVSRTRAPPPQPSQATPELERFSKELRETITHNIGKLQACVDDYIVASVDGDNPEKLLETQTQCAAELQDLYCSLEVAAAHLQERKAK